MFIGALALAVVGNLTVLDGADPWLLRQNYLAADVVEVDGGQLDAPLVEAALRAARPAFAAIGQDLSTAPNPKAPRLILRSESPFPGELDAALERFGFEYVDDGAFAFFGRTYDRENDAVVATFEDPARPGLPLTVWYANSPEALASYVTGVAPQLRPGFASFRHGELELSGSLDANGTLRTTELADRRRAWSERFESDRRMLVVGFSCRVPAAFELTRALDYLDTLVRARRATLLWADPGGAAAESPVAAIGEVNVIVHGNVEEMQLMLDIADLSVVNPVTRTVHALLAPGIPHDGGAAVGESTARRFLGPPSEPWMAGAAGVSAAGTWWGRSLQVQVARLAAAGVVPDLAQLVGAADLGLVSPHILGPLRGYLFQHLADAHPPGYLADLWRGDVVLDVEAERGAWEARLAGLEAPDRGPVAGLELGDWRAGAVLVPGAVGYGSRLVGESLAELAERGAGAISLRATYFHSAPEAAFPGRMHRPPVPGLQGDLELAAAVSAARAANLAVHFELHVLSSASGGYLADLSLPQLADIQDFFAGYEPLLVHGALFADLLGVELFSCGTGLSNTTVPSGNADIDGAREAGWRSLVALAQTLCGAQITYTAGGQYELENLVFRDALDLYSVELFPRLDQAPGGQQVGREHIPDDATFVARMTSVVRRAVAFAESEQRPLFIGAVGFASAREAWLQTDWPRGTADPDLQDRLVQAFDKALDGVETAFPGRLVGLFYWNWSSYPAAGGLADTGYTVQGKTALRRLTGLFENLRL